MSFAEKKLELFRIVADADEELTGKLIAFAISLQKTHQPSAEEVAFYEKRSEEFMASGEKGLTKEESLALLGNRRR
jgi:hypothetical protein